MSSSLVFSPSSILDTDLYKLTMQQAVLHHFPNVQATYRFTNRDKTRLFSRQSVERFQTAVSRSSHSSEVVPLLIKISHTEFTDLKLTPDELDWLQRTCSYFIPSYLSYLSSYRFKPEQVQIDFVPVSPDGLLGHVEVEAAGPWVETILWEVPLMATLSECFFTSVDTDWNYHNQEESAYAKAQALFEAGCTFSEFGTRRRRSYHTQDLVVQSFVRASRAAVPGKGRLSGTSNVRSYLLRRLIDKLTLSGLAGAFCPQIRLGAHRHDRTHHSLANGSWASAEQTTFTSHAQVAAIKGYHSTHCESLDLWEAVYPNSLLIALTDTFTTEAFFKDFTADVERAHRWTGLRQDSGDPFTFGPRVKAMYESLGIDPRQKAIVYSDSLSVDKAIQLQQQADELGFEKVSYGIGTFFTNDFKTASSGGMEKSKALNMVIKLSSVDGKPCIKISDDLTKNTGDRATFEHVKQLYNLSSKDK
ncbi:hypothetical protein H0H92_011875 [Tricholoma furcatifolium]|nr:hypothetical protein H0H92_011875 [Tricholoma furcatifolium]